MPAPIRMSATTVATDRLTWRPGAVETTRSWAALLANGADPDARGHDESTPLHNAVEGDGDIANVLTLLDAGADPMARDRWDHTPLHRLKSANNPEVVMALAGRGADPNARDQSGSTPLLAIANSNRNPAVLAALIDSGARSQSAEPVQVHGPA